jgi:hypothetical protein
MRIHNEDFRKEVREQWFPNHVAKFTEHPDGTKILEWRDKSGTSVYWFTAMLRNGALCIFGDIGEAVYRWYPDVHSWEFFADVNSDYFESKCCASESGRRYYEWDCERVGQRMDEQLHEMTNNEDGSENDEAFQERWALFADEGGTEAAEDEHAWCAWFDMYRDDTRFFHQDDYEWAPGCGRVIANRCVAHLIGIQMALEQRKETASAEEEKR